MKILVIQLTRIGDIFLTLPTLAALKREYPDSELHLLVRSRFASATLSHRAVDHLWILNSKEILSPFISENGSLDYEAGKSEALKRLHSTIDPIKNEKFDKIINLSYSPSSSFITKILSTEDTQVKGYTRSTDLYLSAPDETSRYFRAEVGIGKHNRLHVADLFASAAGVVLKPCDWELANLLPVHREKRNGFAFHLGASQSDKMWTKEGWSRLISKIITETTEPIHLIGAENEVDIATYLSACFQGNTQIVNHVGRTTLTELADIIRQCRFLVGCDSGPMHLASLVGVPTLNLSIGAVRFWETGPTVPGSLIIYASQQSYLNSEQVFDGFRKMKNSKYNSTAVTAECHQKVGLRYVLTETTEDLGDCWPVIDWLYFDAVKPKLEPFQKKALEQISELSNLALKQISIFESNTKNNKPLIVLPQIDSTFEALNSVVPFTAPVVRRFLVEKENIPALPQNELIAATRNCYQRLLDSCSELLAKGTQSETLRMEY